MGPDSRAIAVTCWSLLLLIYLDSEQGVLHAASDPRKDGCAMGL